MSRRKKKSELQTLLELVIELIGSLSKTALLVVAAFLLVVGIGVAAFYYIGNNKVSITKSDRINITPTQIQSIKDIGEWEFLSVSDEELIDTVRKGFLSDDELVRIYYGTLRLGIDMSDAKSDWIRQHGDTVEVTLPPVKLLDDEFIDEARTRSFFESGKWTAKDREQLYQRAYAAMINRCLTPENIESAEQNASRQFNQLLRSMGFNDITIRHTKTEINGVDK